LFDWSRRATRIVLATLAFIGMVMPQMVFSQTPPAPPVVSVSVSGNSHITTDRILGVVKTKVGDPFNPATVQDDLRAINDLGFFADQAPPVIKQRPDGIAITFRVIENPVITNIAFNGNEHVPSDTLLALMDNATGQVFNSRTYLQDVLKINSYYDKIGYGGQVRTHVIDVNIDPKGILTLKVREGLTVSDVEIDGDYLLNKSLILSVLSVKKGTPYSEDARDKDAEKLKDLYKQYDLTIGDFEAGIDPATMDEKAGTAAVRYTISVMRVGAIEITGNTRTHDDVIRRELRLRPGMILTDSAIHRDYDRLTNLGFFEKIELNPKPGPDPKKPATVTLDWQVKEQRTGTAQIGAGYSGGLTGTGLTGTLSYSNNNVNGTGNGGSIKFERGAQISDASLSVSVPYIGHSVQSQKYALGATIFTSATTNYYPVYFVPTPIPAPGVPAGDPNAPVPVSIIPTDPTNATVVDNVASTYQSRSAGVNVNISRRLSDVYRISAGVNVQKVASSATIGLPFFFPTVQNLALGAIQTPIPIGVGGSSAVSSALGVFAPSIANIDSTRPFNLRSFVVGASADSRDDIFNPRRGWFATVTDETSSHSFGSDFDYGIYVADVSRFFPLKRNIVLGLHTLVGTSTGAIPPNKLFTFSDQQLRGYTDPFYGTDEILLQSELRVPLTPDRKFTVVGFAETGAMRIRGAQPGSIDAVTGQIVNLGDFTFHSDIGVGLRFDIPQLGLKTIRLDFAKGANGAHTAFGIGQSF
jgi:outer membrane protein assembly factor BamA